MRLGSGTLWGCAAPPAATRSSTTPMRYGGLPSGGSCPTSSTACASGSIARPVSNSTGARCGRKWSSYLTHPRRRCPGRRSANGSGRCVGCDPSDNGRTTRYSYAINLGGETYEACTDNGLPGRANGVRVRLDATGTQRTAARGHPVEQVAGRGRILLGEQE